ncbi:hypothetical protein B0J13DRAFT_615242 [Dactylonectria estremocensis]|uniref:PHD-type domain-containing protein n=1 Tax=Dactylonectria estremocensis TaxID=1079267 RepID=A0A9P9FJG8_9HYPO|nr:hypothetical protein B0J13DRAFT_615242 [Dactylonectria estremocensis]
MIPSNTRATRSRYSSPAQPPTKTSSWNGLADAPKVSSNQASRAFMQRWLEPSVQAKASFEDDGLVRYGVLENMAPLGSLPKAKKAGPETGPAVRKIILKSSGGNAANSAPEPASKPPAAASSPPLTTAPPTPPRRRSGAIKVVPAADDDDDEDYEPKEAPKRRQSGRVSLGKRTRRSSGDRRSSISAVTKPVTSKETKGARHAKDPKEANQAKEVKGAKEAKEAKAAKQAAKQAKQAAKLAKQAEEAKEVIEAEEAEELTSPDPEVKEFADKVIEAAVDEALKHYRYPTAWALRTLYDENAHSARFIAMIEDVFNQTADAATLRKFSKQIEQKKREGKKDNAGCYYFIPPSTNSRFTPHKPKAAPYGRLLQDSEEPQSEGRAAKRTKTSHSSAAHTHTHSHTHSHATRETPQKMASGASPSGQGFNGEPRTPSRKRDRRDSASSDSSLSSAMSMSLSSPEASGVSVASVASIASPSPPRRRGATSRPGPGSSDAPKSRPITTRRKSLASKSKQPRSSPSTSNSPTLPISRLISSNVPTADASVDANMPGRLSAAQLFPNLPSKSSKAAKNSGKAQVHAPVPVPMPAEDAGDGEDPDAFWDRRRDARQFANSVAVRESSVRGADEELLVTPARRTRKTRHSTVIPATTRSTRSASKRPHDDVEMIFSPVAWSAKGEGSSTVGSRAVTPTLRLPKKQRSGLRVKSSPVKKKGGTAAGLPRSLGEASTANGASKEQASDNDEECSACGAAGDVVCCDGCPRSFHFECVGMVQSESLPDEWFCNECLFKRYPSRIPMHTGVFANALNNLEKSIPRAFSLPKRLQTRFEGVKAGIDGDYEEATTVKTVKKKNGYEEITDFFKQREDGQAVLCHGCQKSATDLRAIVSCSVCPLHWHLDCLDPPLAMPPVPKTWRCPAHVDDVLLEAPPLGPAHRFRKIKGAQPIIPAFSRGLKNNGHIEIDWGDEPELSSNSGWPDPDSFGRAHKIQAPGIVFDVIEQLRRRGAGYGDRQEEPRWMSCWPTTSANNARHPARGSDLQRTADELQVSLALNSLKRKRSENIDDLISALINAADPTVLSLIAKHNADNIAMGHLTNNDKVGLRALLAQMDAMGSRIREALGEVPPSKVGGVMRGQGIPVPDVPSPQDSAIADPDEKDNGSHPVTEPTPPSTIDHAEGSMELD